MNRQNDAFTLVEVLLAVTLGAAVIAAAYAALSTAIDGSRRLDASVEESATVANLAGAMKMQFANAFCDTTSELAPVFSGTPSAQSLAAAQESPRDTIMFSFAARGTCPDADPPFPYYTVTYFIADADGDSPGGLSRRVTPLWPRDVVEEPKDELIAPEVRGLGLAYFDGAQWASQWDAASSGLPRAVRIDLYVDSDRFGKDPWRAPGAAEAPGGRLETYHAVAWLAGVSSPAPVAGRTGAAGAGSEVLNVPGR